MDVASLLAQWPTDWIIVLALGALLSLDALRTGSNRTSTLALSFPLAALALGELPKTAYLGPLMGQFSTPLSQSVLFAIFFVVFYILIRRIIGFWTDSRQGPVQALIAGFACAGILMAVWLQIPALVSLWNFNALIQTIFGEGYRLWWLLGGYAALAYVRS